MKKKDMNWKTTVFGAGGFLVLLQQQLMYMTDNDIRTEADWSSVIAMGFIALQAFFTRDKDVSSKASGVEETS